MKKFLLLHIAFGCANICYADAYLPSINQHQGLYTEINVGTNLYYAGVLFSSKGSENFGGVHGYGWNAAIGYNFTPIVALEGGLMQNYITNNKNQTDHTDVPFVATRFTIPIGNDFSFIGKLGLMNPQLKSVRIVLPYTGVGVSYALTSKTDVNVQYQGAIYGIAAAGLLSTGITYHFG